MGGSLKDNAMSAYVFLSCDLNYVFKEEDPISYVNKLVGDRSPRVVKSEVVLKNSPYIVEGLEPYKFRDIKRLETCVMQPLLNKP